MNTEIVKLLFDFGLVILIWMVQLVVYPSFLFFEIKNLNKWHKKYTLGLSIIVIPLMFGQLFIASIQLFQLPEIKTIINILLIILVWVITFTIFVPIHNKISKNKATQKLLKRLVQYNWLRTILWTLIFFWNLLNILY